jgi:hypothetical protein
MLLDPSLLRMLLDPSLLPRMLLDPSLLLLDRSAEARPRLHKACLRGEGEVSSQRQAEGRGEEEEDKADDPQRQKGSNVSRVGRLGGTANSAYRSCQGY